MFRLAIAVLLALSFGAAGFSQGAPKGPEALLQDGLNEKFGASSVDGVEKRGGQLRIRTGLPVVNDAAYLKVIVETCRLMAERSSMYQDAKEIAVLNRLEKQGYVFKGASKCAALLGLEEEGDEAKALLFADTKFCTRNCD